MNTDVSLLLFSKAPHIASAKTRLQSTGLFPSNFVVDLHTAFVYDCLLAMAQAEVDHRWAAWWPRFDQADFSDLECDFSRFQHFDQVGENFVQRFDAAIQFVFQKNTSSLLVIGSDCPRISPQLLEKAASEVRAGRVVIGPSPEGGFYLLGVPYAAREVCLTECFGKGAESALVADAYGDFPLHVLEELTDIDVLEDLVSFRAWLSLALQQHKTSPELPIYIPNYTARVLEGWQVVQARDDTRRKILQRPLSD